MEGDFGVGFCLCICISTYNKADRILLLIREILKCKSNKLSVVVVDDKSSDDTLDKLNEIKDIRLKVFVNSSNKGARENWFETINYGNGTYLLHLLDRDWIYVKNIERVIDILEREDYDFGYIGEMFSRVPSEKKLVERYTSREVRLEKFVCAAIHPSGFFVKKCVWDELSDKDKFFKQTQYGIYPHSYIFAQLALKYSGLIIKYPLIERVNQSNYARYKSGFYLHEKDNNLMWWTPEAQKWELECLTKYIYDNLPLTKKEMFNTLQYRFSEKLYSATISYRNSAKNFRTTSHYQVKMKFVDENELLKISIKFLYSYLIFIRKECPKLLRPSFVKVLFSIERDILEDILSYR